MVNTSLNKIIKDIITVLQEYDAIDVFDLCFKLSLDRDLYIHSSDEAERESAKKLLPWAIEVLMRLSFAYCKQNYELDHEYDDRKLKEQISKIALWQFKFQENLRHHQKIYMKNYIKYLEYIFGVSPIFDIFRHRFYFTSNKDIYDKFIDKFGAEYDKFEELALYYDISVITGNFTKDKFRKNLEKYNDILKHLSCPIEDIANSYKKCKDQKAFIYLRTKYDLHSCPVIDFGKTFCIPIYYMIKSSVGNILMFKFTDNDQKLQQDVGKKQREKYLYKIVKDSKRYEKVFYEEELEPLINGVGVSDVVATDENNIVFLDSKSTYTNFQVLNLKDKGIKKHIEDIAEDIAQMYKHIYTHCIEERAYQKFLTKEYTANEVYGIVVMRDFTVVKQELIFDQAYKDLELTDLSKKTWMRKHIALLDIHDVEKIVFGGDSLIDFMKRTEGAMDDNIKLNERSMLFKTNKIIYKEYWNYYESLKRKISVMAHNDAN